MENPKFEIRNSKSDLEWRTFSDATCAGLTVLISLPLVDNAFETIFKRRIPVTIASVRRRETANLYVERYIAAGSSRGAGAGQSGTMANG